MYLVKGVLLAFLAFQFFSCENEPLTGEFPQEEQNEAEEGQFRAEIAGTEFIATTVTATINSENELVIKGSKSGDGDIILAITDAAIGNFNLTTGGTNENSGSYFDGSVNILPYSSALAFGGSGQLQITEMDATAMTISGTFSFTGGRVKVDGDGEPILDGEGNPIIEAIEITRGAFNAIEYILDDTGGGGGGGNPENEFFAKVDGVDFVADTIAVSEPMVGSVHMIKIEAKSIDGQQIRIDVPRSLGVGTFNMERISDGTRLTAIYNAGVGAENLTSDPGTITITEFDLVAGVLKATFNFTATDPIGILPDIVEITEGDLIAYFEGVPGANNTFTATVGGSGFDAEELVIETSVVNQYPRVTITATKGDERMELTFPLTVQENTTYEMGDEVIDGDEVVAKYNPKVGTSITYVSSPGSLVITKYDITTGIIEGTFNFTGRDASGQDPTIHQVTNGEFLIILP
ncbi:DUF6252 family protein [Aequorivita sp. Q41]|uniref:DUF6252 family protein n=1 Tax=Aequorivita sp. Q41 TaxID=3153300 RepID=UPI0032424A16